MSKTITELKEIFGIPDESGVRVFAITMTGNPYTELSNYATSNIQVTHIDGECYAATTGDLDASVATEILPVDSE